MIVERLGGVDGELHDRNVGVGKRVREHRPRSVIDAPAVVVEADPHRLDDLRHLLGEASSTPAPGTGNRTAPAGIRRSREWCAASASRSPRWTRCTSAPRRRESRAGAAPTRRRTPMRRCSGCARARSSGCRVRGTPRASERRPLRSSYRGTHGAPERQLAERSNVMPMPSSEMVNVVTGDPCLTDVVVPGESRVELTLRIDRPAARSSGGRSAQSTSRCRRPRR